MTPGKGEEGNLAPLRKPPTRGTTRCEVGCKITALGEEITGSVTR